MGNKAAPEFDKKKAMDDWLVSLINQHPQELDVDKQRAVWQAFRAWMTG